MNEQNKYMMPVLIALVVGFWLFAITFLFYLDAQHRYQHIEKCMDQNHGANVDCTFIYRG